MKADNGKELRRLYDLWNQHIRAIKAFDAYDIDTFLTAIMELKLGEATKLKWMEHSNDSKATPPYTDLLRFMDLQAQHYESAPFERKPQPERKPQFERKQQQQCPRTSLRGGGGISRVWERIPSASRLCEVPKRNE